jgi:hypothetical protein
VTWVQLTLRQSDRVSWALEAMQDFWKAGSDEARDNGHPEGLPVPRIQNLAINLDEMHDDVYDDLIYRLDEQLPDMIDDEYEGAKAARLCSEVHALVNKLKHAWRDHGRS